MDSVIFVLTADYLDGERELWAFADEQAALDFVEAHFDGMAEADEAGRAWRLKTDDLECEIELRSSRLRETGED